MANKNSDQLSALLQNPPALHMWGGEARIGGFQGYVGSRFVHFVQSTFADREFHVLETGAGFSTLLLKALGAKTVTSIEPAVDIGERILKAAATRGIDASGVTVIPEKSESALPRLVDQGYECDLFLIDGAHGWPNVFVDFCFGYMCLRKGGLLLVDDVQIYSVRQLFLFLLAQPGFKCISEYADWKLAAFVKETDAKSVPPYESQQPFIAMNTGR